MVDRKKTVSNDEISKESERQFLGLLWSIIAIILKALTFEPLDHLLHGVIPPTSFQKAERPIAETANIQNGPLLCNCYLHNEGSFRC